MTFYVYGVGLLYEVGMDASGNELTAAYSFRAYHYDQRGCTMAMSSADGHTVTDRFDYSAYGTVTSRYTLTGMAAAATPFQYNGAYGVMNLGPQLLQMRARWYHAGIMRFINPDPSVFSGGLNWFAYADGEPFSKLDPFGLWSWSSVAWNLAKGVVVGAAIAAVIVVAAPLAVSAGAAILSSSVIGMSAAAAGTASTAIVTGALGVGAIVGGTATVMDTVHAGSNGDWDRVAYNVGDNRRSSCWNVWRQSVSGK